MVALVMLQPIIGYRVQIFTISGTSANSYQWHFCINLINSFKNYLSQLLVINIDADDNYAKLFEFVAEFRIQHHIQHFKKRGRLPASPTPSQPAIFYCLINCLISSVWSFLMICRKYTPFFKSLTLICNEFPGLSTLIVLPRLSRIRYPLISDN